MNRQKGKWFFWRLKLILAVGTCAGCVLALFGDYVTSLPEETAGSIPFSWGVQQQAARVAGFFNMEQILASTPGEPPSIDATVPAQTEEALFALG